ncbi:hypothetical protein EGW08_020137, partial [Elysia chlorotica]
MPQRRPSFPQGGFESNKSRQERLARAERRRTIPVCQLPETDEDEDDSDEGDSEDDDNTEEYPGDRYGRETYSQSAYGRPRPGSQHCRGCPLFSTNRRQRRAFVSRSRDIEEDDLSGGSQLCEVEDTEDIATCSSPNLLQPPPLIASRANSSRAAVSRCRCGLFRNGNVRNGVHNKLNNSLKLRHDAKNMLGLENNETAICETAADDTHIVIGERRSSGRRGDTSVVWEDERAANADSVDRTNSKGCRNGANREDAMSFQDRSSFKRDLSRRKAPNTSGSTAKRSKKKRRSRETVILNVGGQTFETYRSTLRRLRTPIFDSDAAMQRYFRRSHGDYFFDRDATAFSSVLNFLRTGELHIPTNMCGPALQSELEFWGIEEVDIARCCWTQYNTWKTQCRSLEKLEYDRKFSTTQQVRLGKFQHLRSSCFSLLVYAIISIGFTSRIYSLSRMSVYAWVSIIFVFISIFSFCAETHPLFKVKARDMTHLAAFYQFFNVEHIQFGDLPLPASVMNHTGTNFSTMSSSSSLGYIHSINGSTVSDSNSSNVQPPGPALPHPALLIMDVCCLAFFTLEYMTRFTCSPNKLNFLRALQNIVDLLAFAPDYVEIMFLLVGPGQGKEGVAVMEMLFILRILRLFRIFRLIRHVPGLWILLYTLKASFNELMLMCVFLLIGMVVFATLIHFAEPDGIFSNIPVGFWWAVVTMTTVGYGDMYPQSSAGYFIGSCCAVAGLLMIAFTVPIIVSNFVLYYTHVQYGLARREREMELLEEELEEELERSRSQLNVEVGG